MRKDYIIINLVDVGHGVAKRVGQYKFKNTTCQNNQRSQREIEAMPSRVMIYFYTGVILYNLVVYVSLFSIE